MLFTKVLPGVKPDNFFRHANNSSSRRSNESHKSFFSSQLILPQIGKSTFGLNKFTIKFFTSEIIKAFIYNFMLPAIRYNTRVATSVLHMFKMAAVMLIIMATKQVSQPVLTTVKYVNHV